MKHVAFATELGMLAAVNNTQVHCFRNCTAKRAFALIIFEISLKTQQILFSLLSGYSQFRFKFYYCDKQFALIINQIVGIKKFMTFMGGKNSTAFQATSVCLLGVLGCVVFPQSANGEILIASTSLYLDMRSLQR